MTLAAVWLEQASVEPVLCFASDSRTMPGPIEGVAKVSLFGRSDIAAVWAGDFRYAGLLVAHLEAFFTSTDAMRARDVDVVHALDAAGRAAKRHLDAAVAALIPRWGVNRAAQMPENTTLLVGGYSIERSSFIVLRIAWNRSRERWDASLEQMDEDSLLVIGDREARSGARGLARRAKQHRNEAPISGWHMEPLTVIDRRRNDVNKTTVGGALQLVKVYRHGNARAFALREALSGRVTIRTMTVRPADVPQIAWRGLLIDLSSWSLPHGRYVRLKRGQIPE